MKRSTMVLLLSLTACVLGILGYIIEYLLFQNAVDAGGLIISGNIYTLILSSVVIALVVFVFLLSRKVNVNIGNPPEWLSLLEGIFVFLIAFTVFKSNSGKLNTIYFTFGCISAWLCILRVFFPQGKFLSHLLVGIYFALHIILQYRASSSDPQVLDYMFPLLADISVMLYSYHVSAAEVGLNKAKGRAFWRYMAVALCVIGAYHGGYAYLLVPVWLLPNKNDQ